MDYAKTRNRRPRSIFRHPVLSLRRKSGWNVFDIHQTAGHLVILRSLVFIARGYIESETDESLNNIIHVVKVFFVNV
jgi:hypothetical protein